MQPYLFKMKFNNMTDKKLTNQEIAEIMGFHKGTVSRDFKEYATDNEGRYNIDDIFKTNTDLKVKYYYLIASQLEVAQNELVATKKELSATALQLEVAKKDSLQLESKSVQLEEAKSELATTASQLEAQSLQLAVTKEQFAATQRELEVAKNRIAATDKNRNEREVLLSQQYSKLQRQYTDLKATASELQRTNTELQQGREELQRKVTELQQNHTVATQNGEELQTINEELHRHLQELQVKRDELQSEVTKLQQSNVKLQGENQNVQQLQEKIETQRKTILDNQLKAKKSKNPIKQIATSELFTYLFLTVTMSATFGFAIREMVSGDLLGAVAHWSEYIPRILTALVLAVAMIWIAFSDLPKKYKIASMVFYGLCEWVSFSNALGLPDMIVAAEGMAWFKVFGITIFSFLLPYTTYQLAHIQTENTNKFELGQVLQSAEALLRRYKIQDTMRFKNDFTELLIAT